MFNKPIKQYIAQVFLRDNSGHSMEFISTLDTHKEKIASIKKGRTIIEERVRFIEKLPQKYWSYSDIKPMSGDN